MGGDTNWNLSNRIGDDGMAEKEQRTGDMKLPQTTPDLENVLGQKINAQSLQQSQKTMKDLEQILDVKKWGFYELYSNEDISGLNEFQKKMIDRYVNEITNKKYENPDGKITIITPDKKEIIRNSVLDGIRFAQYIKRTTKDAITRRMREKAAYYYAYDNDKIKDVNIIEASLIMGAFREGCSYIYPPIFLRGG